MRLTLNDIPKLLQNQPKPTYKPFTLRNINIEIDKVEMTNSSYATSIEINYSITDKSSGLLIKKDKYKYTGERYIELFESFKKLKADKKLYKEFFEDITWGDEICGYFQSGNNIEIIYYDTEKQTLFGKNTVKIGDFGKRRDHIIEILKYRNLYFTIDWITKRLTEYEKITDRTFRKIS